MIIAKKRIKCKRGDGAGERLRRLRRFSKRRRRRPIQYRGFHSGKRQERKATTPASVCAVFGASASGDGGDRTQRGLPTQEKDDRGRRRRRRASAPSSALQQAATAATDYVQGRRGTKTTTPEVITTSVTAAGVRHFTASPVMREEYKSCKTSKLGADSLYYAGIWNDGSVF